MQEVSGRGGASGVGINLFFCGGVVWDGGHPTLKSMQFFPSGATTPARSPPVLARWTFPDNWLVGLVLADARTLSGAREVAFFQSKTPIPTDDVFRTMSHIYHGIIPAVAMADIDLLKLSLEKVHSVGLKREELQAQSRETIDALEKIQTLPRVAVGLSSLGPLLYCVFNRNDRESPSLLKSISRQTGAAYLGAFSGNNTGFAVEPI